MPTLKLILRLIVVFTLVAYLRTNAKEPIFLAVTIDDLPVIGPDIDGITRLEIAKKMISAFKKYSVPEVFGFINARSLEWNTTNVEILKAWIESGNPLGNHTYSHAELNNMNLDKFFDDILKNEPVLEKFKKGKTPKLFRFPYLQEGETLERRNAVRQFLKKNGYQIAQVTIDFEDWAWNEPHHRCATKKNKNELKNLEDYFLKEALLALDEAQAAAVSLGRADLKHILLMHIGAIDGLLMDRLLKAYVDKGVKFVGLSEALKDPIYSIDPQFVSEVGRPFLDQMKEYEHRKKLGLAQGAKVENPSEPAHRKVLRNFCK